MPKTINQKTVNQTTKRYEGFINIRTPRGNPVYVRFGYEIETTNDDTGEVIDKGDVNFAVTGGDFSSFISYPITGPSDHITKLIKAAHDAKDALDAGTIESHTPPE